TEITTALWEKIFVERLGGRPVTRVIVTHHHPDHIGLASWLAERWQVPLWATEREWLFARMLTGNSDDAADLRRAFPRRAGPAPAGSTRPRVKSLANITEDIAAASRRCPRASTGSPTDQSSRSAGERGGSLSGRATPPSLHVFIAPRPAC